MLVPSPPPLDQTASRTGLDKRDEMETEATLLHPSLPLALFSLLLDRRVGVWSLHTASSFFPDSTIVGGGVVPYDLENASLMRC